MKLRALFLAVAVTCTSACGTTPTTPADAAGTEPPLSAYVLPDATFVLHVKAAALRELDLYEPLHGASPDLGTATLVEMRVACNLGPETIDEVVLSGARDEALLVAVTPKATDLLACVGKQIEGAHGARLWELDGLELPNDRVAVIRAGRMLMGSRARVRDALRHPPARAGARDTLSRLEGTPASLLRLYAEAPAGSFARAISWSLDVEDRKLAATVSFLMDSLERADEATDQLRGLVDTLRLEKQPATDDGRAFARMLEDVDVRRRVGGRVSLGMQSAGSGDELASTFRALLNLVQGTTSIYERRVHADEARVHVYNIAQSLVAYAESHRTGMFKMPSLPESAPATPAAVPRGVTTPVSTNDWTHATWVALGFSLTGEVRYTYEIVVAKDKKSAIVRATGDLDGDGETGKLEMTVRLVGSKVEVDSEVRGDDELD